MRTTLRGAFGLIMAALLLVAACSSESDDAADGGTTTTAPTPTTTAAADGSTTVHDVMAGLASDDLQGRDDGTAGSIAAQDLIIERIVSALSTGECDGFLE